MGKNINLAQIGMDLHEEIIGELISFVGDTINTIQKVWCSSKTL